MSDIATTVTDIRAQVEGRLKELEPLVQEYEELRRIAAAIDGDAQAAPRRELRPSGPGRPGSSARADEAERLIAASPGMSVAELAETMGIGPTYLYRLLPRMEREGRLRKEGRGYHVT
jgi:hypothetical protein